MNYNHVPGATGQLNGHPANGQANPSAALAQYTPEQIAQARLLLAQQNAAPVLPGYPQQENPQAALVRYQRENEDLAQENRLLRVHIELMGLQNEGVEFDAQAEAPILASLDDNGRATRYQHMRRYYRNRNDRAGTGVPGLPQLPALPGAAPGLEAPVPIQYQRPGVPNAPVAEEGASQQEQEAVYAVMIDAQQKNQPVPYQEALRQVRYGRRAGGREAVY